MSIATMPASSAPDDKLNDIFAALANTTRRAILARLADGEATVGELAEPFAISLPAISKHIKVLEEVGLITQSRKAQFRPCKLDTAPLQAVAGWTEQYRHIWDTSFDRMDAYLGELQHGRTDRANDPDRDTTNDPDSDTADEQ